MDANNVFEDEAATTEAPPLGCIKSDAAYSLSGFKAALGIGDAALRTWQSQGLAVRRTSKHAFIVGSDFVAWLLDRGTAR